MIELNILHLENGYSKSYLFDFSSFIIVEEVEKKQCRKCGCWRVLKLYRGENATCNICLGYRESWAGKILIKLGT